MASYYIAGMIWFTPAANRGNRPSVIVGIGLTRFTHKWTAHWRQIHHTRLKRISMWFWWLSCLLHYTIEPIHMCCVLLLKICFTFLPVCEMTLVDALLHEILWSAFLKRGMNMHQEGFESFPNKFTTFHLTFNLLIDSEWDINILD